MTGMKGYHLEKEMNEWGIDVIFINETHLKGEYNWKFNNYQLKGKGRKKITKKGGGVAVM